MGDDVALRELAAKWRDTATLGRVIPGNMRHEQALTDAVCNAITRCADQLDAALVEPTAPASDGGATNPEAVGWTVAERDIFGVWHTDDDDVFTSPADALATLTNAINGAGEDSAALVALIPVPFVAMYDEDSDTFTCRLVAAGEQVEP